MTLVLILGLLVLPWGVCRSLSLLRPEWASYLGCSARLGLSMVFLFAAVGHFIKTDEMIGMLPDWIVFRREIVLLSGMLEVLFAIGLLTPRFQEITGWVAICFLVAVYPANVYGAVTGQGLGSPQMGLWYLLLRTPVQLILIAWTYWFAVRGDRPVNHAGAP